MIKYDPIKSKRAGQWYTHKGPEDFNYFIPAPLPPNPPLDYALLHAHIEKASCALGKLEGLAEILPDVDLFMYGYIRKEAVLSSQIEGTQSTLSDLLLFENELVPGVPREDAQEVSNYVSALNYGLGRLKTLPISSRLLREIHARLLEGRRGSEWTPGEFKTKQNWVGGSRPGNAVYVPPPPDIAMDCLGAMEKFVHDIPAATPPLLKAGLVHAQFESIHPFPDGNGRVGRLLITFILCAEGMISRPLLYLSLYFKQHKKEYYNVLQRVRTHGEWEKWLEFYLKGVAEVAEQAASTALKLRKLFENDREKIRALGKKSHVALRVYDLISKKPMLSPIEAKNKLKVSFPALTRALRNLQGLGIVREKTGKKTYQLYVYDSYLKILSEGTEGK
jgi:Fic family protein